MCFRESAENTKLLKRCAHLGNSDDTGLFIQNAAQPHAVNARPAGGLPSARGWKISFKQRFILSGKNLKTESTDILNYIPVDVLWLNPSLCYADGKSNMIFCIYQAF